MTARDVENAAAKLEEKRVRMRQELMAAAAAAILAAVGVAFSMRLTIGCALGAAAGVGLAVLTRTQRREFVESLALEPEAYAIPEVARLGMHVVAIDQREQLAAWIRSLIGGDEQPLQLHLRERIRTHARELEAVAREISAAAARVDPPSAVACRRLLTRPVRSPLYNPNLPEEDLTATLLRIRAGIDHPVPSAG